VSTIVLKMTKQMQIGDIIFAVVEKKLQHFNTI